MVTQISAWLSNLTQWVEDCNRFFHLFRTLEISPRIRVELVKEVKQIKVKFRMSFNNIDLRLSAVALDRFPFNCEVESY